MKPNQIVLIVTALLTCTMSAWAQSRNQLPHQSYYGQAGYLTDGEFKKAIKGYQSEVRGAMKSVSSRWIDSICTYTMLGESYYAVGDFQAALDNYNAALDIYIQYYNWMLDVKFPATGIMPSNNRQINIPWGTGARKKTLGNFPDTFNLQRGQISHNDTLKHGGTIVVAHYLLADVSEIWECTALALYRRYELLGPLCKEDPKTNLIISKLSTRPGPPNHWSQTFIDVALGMAYLGAEKNETAIPLLTRGMTCAGQFDHPLTALVFLALGRQALLSGNNTAAVQYYHESTVAAICYSKSPTSSTILDEAFKGLSAAHLAGNPKSPCPALLPAIQWARTKAGRRLQVTLNTCMAENMLYFQKPAEAAKYLKEAQQKTVGRDFEISSTGAKLNFSLAEMFFQTGKIPEGSQALTKSMEFMSHATPRLYQIELINNLYQSGKMTIHSTITPRKAIEFYEQLLQSPTAVDWSLNPLYAFSAIACANPASYENWFLMAMEREQKTKAIEIADMGRRARFYAPMFAGGRLFNLRQLLETPDEELSPVAKTQKQNVLADFPAYVQLQNQSQKLKEEIQQLPLNPEDTTAQKAQSETYKKWQTVAKQQEVLLYSMLLRRLPVDPVFPSVMTCEEIQKRLPEGEAALIFYSVRGRMFAFLLNASQYDSWDVKTIKNVDTLNKKLHKELTMLDAKRPIEVAKLSDDAWRTTAQELLSELLKNSKADFGTPFPGLVIVPDGNLWYVPFELLQVQAKAGRRPLIYQFKIRYAPTASLAVPRSTPTLGDVEWSFAQGLLYPQDKAEVAQNAFENILGSASTKVAFTKGQMSAPAPLIYSRLQRTIVWDDMTVDYNKPFDVHPLSIDGNKAEGKLSDCLLLPFGAPQTLILPGFHTAEECTFKNVTKIPGFDLFYLSCSLMSEGTQTALVSRWRTGGFCAENLLQIYCQNIPKHDPASAWRVAVLKTAGAAAQLDKEPRITGNDTGTELKMSHPFFWGGYMLFDSGVLPAEKEQQPADGGIQFKKKLN